jgi:hypothetical protein
MLMLVAAPSSAIQLHWSSGSQNLTFTSATRCTLVVEADSAEVRLPSEWRLLWAADSSSVQFVTIDSLDACLLDSAQVSRFEGPATAADSAANLITAHFCSAGSNPTFAAQYILDLAACGHGNLKAVALDPTDPDSRRVIESNEATYNGGVDGSYPPAILRASRSHPSTQLRVEAVGVGLASAGRVEIAAPDTSWRLTLNVTERSDTALTAVAQVAADLPPFVLQVGSESNGIGIASLDADTASEFSIQPACVSYMREYDADGHTYIQPKDFAVVASRDSFHIFYIRHDMRITNGDLNEKSIGHKRSRNLNDWDPTTGTMIALEARPGQWDNHHVWAPSIVKKPNDITYWMFYTGVRDTTIQNVHTQVQRIGVASSTDLNIWTPENTWVYSHSVVPWSEPDSSLYSGQQFRDPFVMEDPDSAGHYLMFFVAGSRDRKPRMAVGVARTRWPVADFHNWYNVGPLWNTDAVHTRASIVESPHAFADPGGRWWLYYTGWNPGSPNDSAFVCFETNNVSPIDADTTTWSTSSAPPDTLYRFLGGDQTLQFWHGSEYLKWAPGYEYLFAYDDNQHSVDISEISWHGPHVFALNDSCAPSVPLAVDAGRGGSRFALAVVGGNPARGRMSFAIVVPYRMHVQLAIYDVLGRRIKALLDEEVPAGERIVHWDGTAAGGIAAGSGLYFGRVISASGQRAARVVLIR